MELNNEPFKVPKLICQRPTSSLNWDPSWQFWVEKHSTKWSNGNGTPKKSRVFQIKVAISHMPNRSKFYRLLGITEKNVDHAILGSWQPRNSPWRLLGIHRSEWWGFGYQVTNVQVTGQSKFCCGNPQPLDKHLRSFPFQKDFVSWPDTLQDLLKPNSAGILIRW